MASLRSFRSFHKVFKNSLIHEKQFKWRCLYSTDAGESESLKPSRGGFAKAFEKYTKGVDDSEPVKEESFATLLKKSKFVDVSALELF